MKRVLIFGTGSTGQRIFNVVKKNENVIGFLDNDPLRWNSQFNGIPVLGNEQALDTIVYDEIIIASLPGLQEIKQQLLKAGVYAEKIRTDLVETQYNARINFLYDFAVIYKDKVKEYAVAEGGVFQGDFAKEINFCFPDSTLYLFDTFEGFSKRDVSVEEQNKFSGFKEKHLGITSEEDVLNKLPYKDKAVIKKGYFPETTQGLENVNFFFVNLDFDLYNPTIAGLRFFVPRLIRGGVILIHDYFNPGYPGVAQAVRDFKDEYKGQLFQFPIGDHCSLGIMVTD